MVITTNLLCIGKIYHRVVINLVPFCKRFQYFQILTAAALKLIIDIYVCLDLLQDSLNLWTKRP